MAARITPPSRSMATASSASSRKLKDSRSSLRPSEPAWNGDPGTYATPAEVAGHIVFRTPQLPAPVLDALGHAEQARTDADSAAVRAAEAKAAAARALVRDVHLSMRDAAEILGVSHQRVQQLLSPTPAPTGPHRTKSQAPKRVAS